MVFSALLLTLIVPFMLLMIPLYVMIVRWYGLSDSYLGMIVPYAINPAAVFIFRQFFKQIPASLFESARIDGGSELSILLRVAVPLARPAILTAVVHHLHRPVERVPVAVPGDQAAGHAAARGGARQLHEQRRRGGPRTRSARSSPAPRVLAVPAVLLYAVLPALLHAVEPRVGGQGLMATSTDGVLAGVRMQRLGVVMAPDPDDPGEAWGVLNPASARDRDGDVFLFPRLVAEGNESRVGRARVLYDDGGRRAASSGSGWRSSPRSRGSETSAPPASRIPGSCFCPRSTPR